MRMKKTLVCIVAALALGLASCSSVPSKIFDRLGYENYKTRCVQAETLPKKQRHAKRKEGKLPPSKLSIEMMQINFNSEDSRTGKTTARFNFEKPLSEEVCLLYMHECSYVNKRFKKADKKRNFVADRFMPGIKHKKGRFTNLAYLIFSDKIDHLSPEVDDKEITNSAIGTSLEGYFRFEDKLTLIYGGRAEITKDNEHGESCYMGATKHFKGGFVLARWIHQQDSFSKLRYDKLEIRASYEFMPDSALKPYAGIGVSVGSQQGFSVKVGARPVKDLEFGINGFYLRDNETRGHISGVGVFFKLKR
ncbi:hypothetical protein KY317_03825 [Candidatus Woesearchaeota archaeon]|nr:hypothetical protein [Candidatus Woesearchaeota archaeon]